MTDTCKIKELMFRKCADLLADRAGNCSSETNQFAWLPASSSLSQSWIVPDLGARCDRFPARSRHSVFSIQTWHGFLPTRRARAKWLSPRRGIAVSASHRSNCVSDAWRVTHERLRLIVQLNTSRRTFRWLPMASFEKAILSTITILLLNISD